MGQPKRVLYLHSRDDLPQRSMLSGFYSFASRYDWLLTVLPRWRRASSASLIKEIDPDLCIAGPMVWTESNPGIFEGRKVVGLEIDIASHGHPSVIIDNEAVGRLAAQFFLAKGFVHFAVLGNSSWWSAPRVAGFRRELEQRGKFLVAEPFLMDGPGRLTVRNWLGSLPPPTGVLATTDVFAEEVMAECRLAGIHIPDEISILAVDNDELICEFCVPRLSSLQLPYFRQGQLAAMMGHRLLQGRAIRDPRISLAPISAAIVERQSTGMLSSRQPAIADAMRFIREKWNEPIQVDDVARAVLTNRRWLERAFLKHIGHGIAREIQHVRISHVKQLLGSTNLAMPEIARRCGFQDSITMGNAFRKLTQMTPSAYRMQFITFK
jgi:LacI family transcriptional regulator